MEEIRIDLATHEPLWVPAQVFGWLGSVAVNLPHCHALCLPRPGKRLNLKESLSTLPSRRRSDHTMLNLRSFVLFIAALAAFWLPDLRDARAQEALPAPAQGQPAPQTAPAGAAPAEAQPTEAADTPAGQAAAPQNEVPEEVLPKDKTVRAFAESLEKWEAEIKTSEAAIAAETTSDAELRQIPEQLEALRESIVDQRGPVGLKLQDARERLAKLGPPPKEGAPKESADVTAQRKRLEAEVATIDGRLKRADILFLRANQLITAANNERRERFMDSLFDPVPNFYSYVLPNAFKRLPGQATAYLSEAESRLARLWHKGILAVILVFAAPFAGFALARRFVTNMAARIDAKESAARPQEPTLQERGTWALRMTVRRSLPIWMAMLALYFVAIATGMAYPTSGGFFPKTLLAIAWAVFLLFLVRYSLVPDDEAWQVVPADRQVAWRVSGLLWVLIVVWTVDVVLTFADTIVFTAYQVSILRSAFFAMLYALLIAIILRTIQTGPVMRKGALSGWRAWLFSGTAIAAAVIFFAALLGYESLARFIGMHAVSTAGVLWAMYLFHLAAESISSVSVISGQTLDEDVDEEEERDAPSLLTIRIIVSLLLDISILAIGITILLLLWRFDWVEVRGWIQAAFFGFQFGNLRISLQSVLIALGVFAVGLLLTRFVQRWVTERVFVGRHSDSGLHESIKIGIGYLGFVLAALAGVSYLGFDFSNIAIVAGALSVGIGFGLQSIFNNFVSGLILLVERPIKIGDYIEVGGQEGTVKKISVRSTEIETVHQRSVIIPNATLITDPVVNWMHLDRNCRLDIPIGVDYDTDVEQLRTTLLRVAERQRGVMKSPPPLVHFAGFGDSSLDFELRVYLRDVGVRLKTMSELRFAILAAFREADISIPFPQRDVHVKGGPAPEEGIPDPQ